MCRNIKSHSVKLKSPGISLLAMIVFVVVIAIISAALVKLTSVAGVTIGYEMVNLRSFFAAESGAQNQLARLFPLAGGGATCATLNLSFSTSNLNGCTATVSCIGPIVIESDNFYTINSVGQCGSGDAISIRELQVQVRVP